MQVLDVAAKPRHATAGPVRDDGREEVIAARRAQAQASKGNAAASPSARAWSRRVLRVGGSIQAAFAVFWLLRGAVAIGGRTGDVLVALSVLAGAGAFGYAAVATAGKGARPRGEQARSIEKAVTIGTALEFLAALALPLLATRSGHPDWALPSIAITIGPLLLYLDHLLQIPRYRIVGWALTVGPLILVAALSGTALVATTGLASGLLLLITSAAGFRELAGPRPARKQ
jgi:hypothetical protein